MKEPLLVVGLSFLTGIVLASFLTSAVTAYVVSFAAAPVVFLLIRYLRAPAASIGICALLALAGFQYSTAFNLDRPESVRYLAKDKKQSIIVKGIIQSEPIYRRKIPYFPEIDFIIKPDGHYVNGSWKALEGLAAVRVYNDGKLRPRFGDSVIIAGKIYSPPALTGKTGFDYRTYLGHKRIFAVIKSGENGGMEITPLKMSLLTVIKRKLFAIKERLRGIVEVRLAQPYSGILRAMILGDRHALTPEAKDIFVKTGTMHVIAISGLHFGIMIFILLALLKMTGMPAQLCYLLTALAITLFALLVGEGASVARAVIMGDVFLIGLVFDRKSNLLNLLGAALIVQLILDPNSIYDVGFVLTYACMFSIVYIYPRFKPSREMSLEEKLTGKRSFEVFLWLTIKDAMAISSAVFLGVCPIVAYIFHIISPSSLLVNLFAVPVSFIMIAAGIAAMAMTAFIPAVALIIFEALYAVSWIFVVVLDLCSRIPFGSIELLAFPIWALCAYYAFLALFLWAFSKNTKTCLSLR